MQLKNVKTNFLGKRIFYYKVIDSTQKEIWRRIQNNNIENGTLIYADIQECGIGTFGKTWYTDEQNNIAFSFYIKTNCSVDSLNGLTVQIAKTICKILKDNYKIEIQIKEPNDLYYKGKKLGGILTQTKVLFGKVNHLVVGIGINTNKKEFTKELETIATSIYNEFKVIIDTQKFIIEFCNEFEKELLKLL